MNISVSFNEQASEYSSRFGEDSTNFPIAMQGWATNSGNGGENGATFIPFVSDDGMLFWVNDKGLPNPAPVNIKGKDGNTPYIQNGYWYINGVNTNVKAQGVDGKNGTNGKDGADGYTPVKGVDYFDGKDGIDGKDGKDGVNGIDGYTPVKGTDYFTDADKAEMVSAVIAALPVYNGEVVTA